MAAVLQFLIEIIEQYIRQQRGKRSASCRRRAPPRRGVPSVRCVSIPPCINAAKSAVDRPWNRTFLGYSMTVHMVPKLRVAANSVARFKAKVRAHRRRGRGRNLKRTIDDIAPVIRGWMGYFRLAETKGIFDELDRWIRRQLRCILWRQWKRPATRMVRLMQRGLPKVRARASADNGWGPWRNAGAAHMNDAFRNGFFAQLGLRELQKERRRLNRAS